MTFEERFCSVHGCDADAFRRRVFFRAIPPLQRPFAALFRWMRPHYFRSDDEFLYGVGEACTLDEIRREARVFYSRVNTHGWLRRVARVRVSAGRMIRLAKQYVPDGDSRKW